MGEAGWIDKGRKRSKPEKKKTDCFRLSKDSFSAMEFRFFQTGI